MKIALHRLRQIVLAVLFVTAAVWLWSEGGQWLLRWRTQRLLADIRAVRPGSSSWSDAQHLIATWSRFGSGTGPCDAEFCKYEIDLVHPLPSFLTGTPGSDSQNWIARVATSLGIRAAAARAGFTVQQGVLTSKWFGEQVTVPLRDWDRSQAYVPYLSVSAREASLPHAPPPEPGTSHPMRLIHHERLQFAFSFTAQEPEANRDAFYDFQLNCITRLSPCELPADILPQGWKILQQN